MGVVTPKATTTLNTTSPKHKRSRAAVRRSVEALLAHHLHSPLSTSLKIGELFAVASTTQLTRGQIDGSGEGLKVLGVAKMQLLARCARSFCWPVRRRRLRFQDWTEAQKNSC